MESFFVPYTATSVLDARCVAVLAPHADDEILGCGGALASLASHAIPVHVAVVSDEFAGEGSGEAVDIRHSESRAAAAIIGYGAPDFWGLPDGSVQPGADLVEKISRWLADSQADLLLAPSCWEMHRDHRAVAEAAIAAVIRQKGRVRLGMYEVGVPLLPNTLLDITPFLQLKQRAMACFASQLARQRYDLHMAGLNRYRTYTLPETVEAAEAYLILTADELGTLKLDRQPGRESLALHRAEKAVAERHEEARQLNEAIRQLNEAVGQRDGTIGQLNEALGQRDEKIGRLNETVTQLSQDLRFMEEQAHMLRESLNAMTTDRDQLLAALAQMRSSTSWRVTAPMRFVGHLVRGDFATAGNVLRAALAGLRRRLPTPVKHRFRKYLSRLKVFGSLLTRSKANDPAIAAIVAERCRFTRENPAADPLCAVGLPAEPPMIDVCIVTHNSGRWVADFVHSLRALDYPKSRLVVRFVDNASTDGTLAAIQSAVPQLQASGCRVEVLQRPNHGFGAGHNTAIRAGNAPFCLVTNVDLTFQPDALSRAVASALSDVDRAVAWEFRQKPYEHPKFYDPVTGTTNWNSHACVLLRRSALEKVRGYDETLFMYGEDVELSYRLRREGFLLRYCPAALVMHYTYEAAHQVKPLQYTGSAFASLYLRLKYGTWGDLAAVPILAANVLFGAQAYPGSRKAVLRTLARLALCTPKALLGRRRGQAHFPFHGWDYDLTRMGGFVPVFAMDAERPLVSIITRTYRGRALYLRQALLSAAHQTYPSIEHIVVEDGGDTLRELVAGMGQLTGRPATYIALDKVGRSVAGNAGLAAATGRWCLFLDDDDLLFADHVEVLVHALRQDRDAVAAYTPAWEVFTDSAHLKDGKYQEYTHEVPLPLQQPFDRNILLHHNMMAIQSVLFERRLFIQRGGFDEDMEALEDWVLWLRYSCGNHFLYVPKVTSLFRTPADSGQYQQRLVVLDAAYKPAVARAKAQAEALELRLQ
ncbi:MAG: glycosyltransferase [Betaproteobacteria bacterium]|nr:glycosyltransferase [Betaproteobacteria bacterium]